MPETAILAYREQRRDGASHHTTWLIAVVALREVWPLPLEDAKRKTTHAIRARITRSDSGMG